MARAKDATVTVIMILLMILGVTVIDLIVAAQARKANVHKVEDQAWLKQKDAERKLEFEHAERVHLDSQGHWALWISPAVPAAIVGALLVLVWVYIYICGNPRRWRQQQQHRVLY